MGWTSYYKPASVSTDEELRNYLHNHLLEGHEVLYDCVRASGHGDRVLYAALRLPDGTVTALVLLGNSRNCDFCVKEIGETMGPAAAGAPAKLLNLLTPADNEYALAWRKRCWDNVAYAKSCRAGARRVDTELVGKTIRLAEPISYGDYGPTHTFDVVSRTELRGHHLNVRFRARAPREWWMREFEVLDEAS